MPRKDCTFIHSTYLDNVQFLPPEMVKEIENLKSVDENYWRIYGLGEIGQITGVIFTNWEAVDAWPQSCKWITYGMDFGFSNDPTALVRVGMSGGELYVDELIYSRGLTNPDICKWMSQLGITRADEIIADNQPKCIYEIKQEGYNIKPTFKGADSVLAGIDILKRYPMKITKRSVNLIRELKNYKWKEDAAGKPVNMPIDRFNHAIDAIRYACMGRLFMGNRLIKTSRHLR